MRGMHTPIRCQAVSWHSVEQLVRSLAERIRAAGFRPDVVVAIARGGFVPARLLCDRLGVMALASLRIEHYRGQRRAKRARVTQPLNVSLRGKRVLVVDDLSDTGDTFIVAVAYLAGLGAREVRTAALHHKQQSHFEPDYYARRIKQWRWIAYPWARIEDVSALIGKLERPLGSAAQVARQLQARHGLRVPLQTICDALALMR